MEEHPKVRYPTRTVQRRLGEKLYVLETIRDLDEAIDLLCAALGPDSAADPFAEDLCPYYGILWPAAEGLAQYLVERPASLQGKRVLELGCGLGLPSLVAAHSGAQALATDFHPEVGEFFARNLRHCSLDVPYRRLNWREPAAELGRFDVVMGSDVLYEARHPADLAEGLLRWVAPGGQLLLADPGRSYLKKFLEEMGKRGLSASPVEYQIAETKVSVFAFST